MNTTNAEGHIVSGTLVRVPGGNDIYIVGEVSNNKCKLYNNIDNSFYGEYNISELSCI